MNQTSVRLNRSWIFLTVLILVVMGCAFVQEQLQNLTNPTTETLPAASLVPAITGVIPTDFGKVTITTVPTRLASTEVRQPADLLNIISGLDWTYSGGYTSLPAPVSGDLEVPQALTLTAAEIQAPASCLDRPDCRHAVAIELSKQLPAISCRLTEQVLGGDYCAAVDIPAGSRFRLRGILYDTHPAQWNFISVLQILPASDVPCLADELRCAADSTCFTGFDEYCRSCLGLEKERCACQSPEGSLPEGSDCQYWVSGDVLQSGKCRQGVCK
jgi:hypothetical protein